MSPDPRGAWRAVSLVAFLVCTFAAALYPLWATSWSGADVRSFDVREGSSITLLGLTWTHASPLAHEVGPVHLAPAMNPVRVLAHVGFSPLAAGRPTCRVAMRDDAGNVLWSEAHGFGAGTSNRNARRANTATVPISTFAVAREGDYTFAVDVDARRDDAIQDLRLEVRRNVASVDWRLELPLAVLALVALGGVLATAPSRTGPMRRAA